MISTPNRNKNIKLVVYRLILTLLVAVGFVLMFSIPVHAQLEDSEIAAGLESCFQYYDYGKIEVNLTTEKSQYKNRETAKIIGTVVNKNSFPLMNVVVYAQLRRTNLNGDIIKEGHHLLERKQITSAINLLPNETRSITASFPILDTYPNGSYQLQYYIVSLYGFHYAGRPFLEEDFGGSSFFDIKENTAPLVYFNLASIQVNQNSYPIRGVTQEFKDDILNLSAAIIDNRAVKTDIPVTVKFYAFEDTFEKYLLSTEQKTISAQTGKVDVQFKPSVTGAYVMVLRINSPTVSEIKYRFAKIGGTLPALRINDIGATSYPPTVNDKAYICFHSPASASTSLTSVTLKILDKNKKLINEKTITREFSGSVLAESIPFGAIKDNSDFWVQGNIKWQGAKNEPQNRTFEVHYNCDTFQSSPKELTVSFESKSSTLAIGAQNNCNKKIETGGNIESIRIKNEKGKIVKELYNIKEITQNINVDNLPVGNYIAEVRSGDLSKKFPFMVAGTSTKSNHLKQLMFIFLILLPVFLLIAAVYYRMRKHKQIQDHKQEQV